MNPFRTQVRRLSLGVGALCAMTASLAQVTTYDPATGVVTIPSVSVGATTYTGVTLKNRGNSVFDLVGFVAQPAVAFPGAASYDTSNGVLTLPAVKLGSETYLDVKLQDGGNYAFTLQAATLLEANVVQEIAAYARSLEALTATAIPSTGTARLALADACWASDGRTRAHWIAEYDANRAEYMQRDSALIGRRIQNIQVLALRNRTNADGSARREIDVQWDVAYTDGSKQIAETATLISGSSAGTPGCSTAQTGSTLRALGNQRVARVQIRANNLRQERYALATGAEIAPSVRYRREIEFNVVDPMGNITYAVVHGPGPTNSIGGTVYPFSMKLLSPRLLRSAPELQGKPGNFLNWDDNDSFRNCYFSNNTPPVAQFVDCVANGATSNSWGWGYVATPDAAADDGFAAQGWVAGGMYRFDLYNDDGWRTVNGHAGKTPVATYYAKLTRLPYTFAEMAGKYPTGSLGALSPAQVASNATSATPVALALNWTLPVVQADGVKFPLNQGWEFHQGPKVGNSGTAFNPAYRVINRVYPGTTATAGTFPVTVKLPDQQRKSYTEYTLFFAEPGTFHSIRALIAFQ